MKNKSAVIPCPRASGSIAISGVRCLILQENFTSETARDEFEKAIAAYGAKLLEAANEPREPSKGDSA